jgi:hypothetical protein
VEYLSTPEAVRGTIHSSEISMKVLSGRASTDAECLM